MLHKSIKISKNYKSALISFICIFIYIFSSYTNIYSQPIKTIGLYFEKSNPSAIYFANNKINKDYKLGFNSNIYLDKRSRLQLALLYTNLSLQDGEIGIILNPDEKSNSKLNNFDLQILPKIQILNFHLLSCNIGIGLNESWMINQTVFKYFNNDLKETKIIYPKNRFTMGVQGTILFNLRFSKKISIDVNGNITNYFERQTIYKNNIMKSIGISMNYHLSKKDKLTKYINIYFD